MPVKRIGSQCFGSCIAVLHDHYIKERPRMEVMFWLCSWPIISLTSVLLSFQFLFFWVLWGMIFLMTLLLALLRNRKKTNTLSNLTEIECSLLSIWSLHDIWFMVMVHLDNCMFVIQMSFFSYFKFLDWIIIGDAYCRFIWLRE